MNARAFLLPAAALLLAVGGCDYGGEAGGDDPALESPQAVEFPLTSQVPTRAGTPVTERAPATEAEADPVAEQDSAQEAARPVADCIDLSSGTPLLVPCTLRQVVRAAPVGHDDPDPWRPVANPANPTH